MSNSVSVTQIEEWLVLGEHQQAMDACLDLLAEHPSHPDLRALLALCEEAAGDQAKAIERLEQVLVSDPEHVRTLFHLGRLLLAEGQLERANDQLQVAVALAPNHAPTRHLLARLDQQRGNTGQAIESLRIALRADPDYIPALCDLAVLLVESGNSDEAHQHASHAVKLDADEAGVQLAMGLVFEAQRHWGFAEQCLVNATDQDPDSYQGLMALARVYQAQGKHAAALHTLDRLASSHKDILAARYARAFSLARLGQLAAAKSLFESIINEQADAKTTLQLMDLYIQSNDAKGLVTLATELQRTEPSLVWAGTFIDARLAEFAGKFTEAIGLLTPLVDTDVVDQQIRARLLLARLHLKNADPSAAVETLKTLADLPKLHYRVCWEMAQLSEQAGDLDFALRMIDAVLADPSHASDVMGRSATMRLHLLDRLGRFSEAKAQLEAKKPRMGWLPVPTPFMETQLPAIDWAEWKGKNTAPEGLPALIWVPGWPWAGRELVLAALAQIDGAKVLPMAEGSTRFQHLGMVPGQPYHVSLDAEQVRPMCKRYLRGAPPDAKVLIEPFPCKAAELIRMHQIFPAAQAVRVTCEPDYLRLQWHLAGYQDVEPMLTAWLEEQAALNHLVDQGEIPLVSVALEGLLDPATVEATISQLMSDLVQTPQPKMSKHVQALMHRHSYRGSKHWHHYFL